MVERREGGRERERERGREGERGREREGERGREGRRERYIYTCIRCSHSQSHNLTGYIHKSHDLHVQ